MKELKERIMKKKNYWMLTRRQKTILERMMAILRIIVITIEIMIVIIIEIIINQTNLK
jgi:hypothetical protein